MVTSKNYVQNTNKVSFKLKLLIESYEKIHLVWKRVFDLDFKMVFSEISETKERMNTANSCRKCIELSTKVSKVKLVDFFQIFSVKIESFIAV